MANNPHQRTTKHNKPRRDTFMGSLRLMRMQAHIYKYIWDGDHKSHCAYSLMVEKGDWNEGLYRVCGLQFVGVQRLITTWQRVKYNRGHSMI